MPRRLRRKDGWPNVLHLIHGILALGILSIFGMVNQVFTGTPTSRRFAACPSSIVSGQPVLIGGQLPAVALDSYQADEGGTTFLLGGSFNLSVYGETGSPPTNAQIWPGQAVYAENGQTDPTTQMVYNFILTSYSGTGSVLFGRVDPSYNPPNGVLSGLVPDTAAVVMLDKGL
jgi:hypothetical protein